MDPGADAMVEEILERDPKLSDAALNLPDKDDFFDSFDEEDGDNKENIPPTSPELKPLVSQSADSPHKSVIHSRPSQVIYKYENPPLVSPIPSPGLIENPPKTNMSPKAPIKRSRKTSTAPARRRKLDVEKPTAKSTNGEESNGDTESADSMLKRAVEKRVKNVQERLAEVDANNGEVNYEPKSKFGWLFTIEKSLRYTLCDNCVKMYLKDEDKITEFENGYVMLNLMLCPSCVTANNDVKRAWKHGFGRKWEGGSWGSGGGGGAARGGWGGNSGPRGYAAGGSRY
jgi:hypothetical protein